MSYAHKLPFLSKDEKALVGFYVLEITANMSDDDFQRDFFESLCSQWESREYLSEKQRDSLKKIYERLTS